MSTTLIPPTFYLVTPRDRPARVYPTLGAAAAAIVVLGSTPAAVGALTGRRSRALTDGELWELGRGVRACGFRGLPGWMGARTAVDD